MSPARAPDEAAGLALLETIRRQRDDLMRADGDTIHGYALEIQDAVSRLFGGPMPPILSTELLSALRTALETHARLVATAAARVDRGLAAMGLETAAAAVPGRRSRFATPAPAHGSTRLTA